MKLHASAALSLKKRRLLVHRVIDEGWSLGEAAEAADEVGDPPRHARGEAECDAEHYRPPAPPTGT